jgi:hypothetical protein
VSYRHGIIDVSTQQHWFINRTGLPSRLPDRDLKGQIRGFQILPMCLDNIPVIQRDKKKDFGFSGMLNYEVIQVYI